MTEQEEVSGGEMGICRGECWRELIGSFAEIIVPWDIKPEYLKSTGIRAIVKKVGREDGHP